jgi:hypothetical protein
MKFKLPKISKGINHQIVMVLILLVLVIFITVMPWASNTFHEALETMDDEKEKEGFDDDDERKDGFTGDDDEEKKEGFTGGDDEEKEGFNEDDEEKKDGFTGDEDEKEKEGFVGDGLFKNSATTFPGARIDTTNWNSNVNLAGNSAVPLDRNSLYMFNSAHFSPNCCAKGPGSGMSTSMGCACLTNSDAFYITEGRGGGNMNPTQII